MRNSAERRKPERRKKNDSNKYAKRPNCRKSKSRKDLRNCAKRRKRERRRKSRKDLRNSAERRKRERREQSKKENGIKRLTPKRGSDLQTA